MLDPDPTSRWTPRQAAAHPFITGEPFLGPFQPPADPGTACAAGPPLPPRESPLSPAPVGTPMTIPAAPAHPRATVSELGSALGGGGGGAAFPVGSPWLAPGIHGGAAMAIEASPQAHAQAHAAAMAAVQAHMALRQQAELAAASLGGGASGAAAAAVAAAAAEYDPAHSLQRILPPAVAAAMAATYGTCLGGGAGGGGLGPPSSLPDGLSLLSPPSRTFGAQLRYAGAGAALLDGGCTPTGGGVLPLLATTPLGGGGLPGLSPMSFQPASIRTYQAMLAGALAGGGTAPTVLVRQTAAPAAPLQPLQQQTGFQLPSAAPPLPCSTGGLPADGYWAQAPVAADARPPPPGQEPSVEVGADWDPLWIDDLDEPLPSANASFLQQQQQQQAAVVAAAAAMLPQQAASAFLAPQQQQQPHFPFT